MASVKMRKRTRQKTGTYLVVGFTLLTVALVGLSILLRVAANGAYARIAQARGVALDHEPDQFDGWVSARFSKDVPRDDLVSLEGRAGQLASRSDRLREITSVPALIGLLSALLLAAPPGSGAERNETSQPEASTANNGTV